MDRSCGETVQQEVAQKKGPKKVKQMKKPPEDSLKSGKMKAKWAYDSMDWVKADLAVKFWGVIKGHFLIKKRK